MTKSIGQALESREAFETRFPRPPSHTDKTLMARVLVRCQCDVYGYDENDQPIEHWAWTYWDFRFPGLAPYETLAEPVPDFEKITGRKLTEEDLKL